MKSNIIATLALTAGVGWSMSCVADQTDARCDIYRKGSDHADKMIPCTFGQRQGFITITRQDGVTHEVSPVGDAGGTDRDQHGHPAHHEDGLGRDGEIFRFANAIATMPINGSESRR